MHFDLELYSNLIKKLEFGTISELEHNYLKKLISISVLLEKYRHEKNKETEFWISRYYAWLCRHYNNKNNSPKLTCELFLLKASMEALSPFKKLQSLAKIWGISINQNKNEVLNFLIFFTKQCYDIPENFINEIIYLIQLDWRPIFAPISSLFLKRYSLKEIEEYFFGNINHVKYETHVLNHIDRLFSITSPKFQNHIFIPKTQDFDYLESSLIVHEFQHIQDSPKTLELSLFASERNAINAEKVFLNIAGTGKKGKFNWMESNLFYPLLLLKWELDIILSDTYDISYFHTICQNHGMKPLNLSPLFEFDSPFQMSAYCAGLMDLEPNWKNYLKNFEGL